MSYIFSYSGFNGDVSNWNTSNVTNMQGMFSRAIEFNQPLNFNTSNVTSMKSMFAYTSAFNQPLNNWNTSNVTDMSYMFYKAIKFNQELKFDTSKVTNMKGMFSYAEKFNQPLNFDTSNVVDMDEMFDKASAFINKYNSGETLPIFTNDIKEWLNDNRDIINDIDTKNKYGKEIDDFFANITDIYSTNRIGLHENLLTEYNKSSNRMQQAICL